MVAHDEPAGQLVHVVALANEYFPVVQATGAAEKVAQDDPAGQAVQTEAPTNA